MQYNSKIYVAGHRGMLGSSICRTLSERGYNNLIVKSRKELNLVRQADVEDFFMTEKPEYVFLAAARVGGIVANNTYPAEFIYDNLMIESNIIKAAHDSGVNKLIFISSTCAYPKHAEQPISEDSLLTGVLEPTNEGFAVAKIAGIKLCQTFNRQYGDNFLSCMSTNIYGPNDNFDLQNSHVLSALMHKIHIAKTQNQTCVEVWGTGAPLREFIYVDDVADACIFLMQNYNSCDLINVGTGKEVSIKDLALIIKDVIGYTGEFEFNHGKPDGAPRKLCNSSKIKALGWINRTDLIDGLSRTYDWFLTSGYNHPQI